MELLKYFSVKNKPAALPSKVSLLSIDELEAVTSRIQKIIEENLLPTDAENTIITLLKRGQ